MKRTISFSLVLAQTAILLFVQIVQASEGNYLIEIITPEFCADPFHDEDFLLEPLEATVKDGESVTVELPDLNREAVNLCGIREYRIYSKIY